MGRREGKTQRRRVGEIRLKRHFWFMDGKNNSNTSLLVYS